MAHTPNLPQPAAGTITAPYPAEDFAELLTHEPSQAFAVLGAMTPEQREAQAEAYVTWLRRFRLSVLSRWNWYARHGAL